MKLLWAIFLPLLLALPGFSIGQTATKTITGQVRSTTGELVQGVSVTIKDTKQTTLTSGDGRFSINTTEGRTLVFTHTGFTPVEVVVGSDATVDITLTNSASQLNDVVVVGYGNQKKASLTSAVSDIKSKDLVRRPVSNVAQALQGNVPGLTVLDQGGGPGKSDVRLRVRGVTTLSGNNQPLILVDGVEQRMGDVNPADIESISILKDASSTAIYGSRAANGVLLVTTKRAKQGKPQVSYDAFYAIQKSANFPEHMEVGDYMRLQNVAYTNVGSPIKYTDAQIEAYVNATNRYKYPLPYTMAEAVLKTAPQINQSLAISGGNENLKTRLSLRHQYQEGIIPNSEAKLTEIRLNTDYQVFKNVKISGDVNYRHLNTLAPVDEFKVWERLKHGSLFTVPKYPDGTYGISAQGENALLYAELHGSYKTAGDFIYGNAKAEWEIIKGLTWTTQFAARIEVQSEKRYFNKYNVYDYYDPTILRRTAPNNTLTETRNIGRETTLNHFLSYTKGFGLHDLTLLAGYSEIKNNGTGLTAYRQGFYNNDIQSIDQGANDNTRNNSGLDSVWALRSYFGRINYAFNDKYLFEANARYDGSSRFTGSNRYSFFPSFSAGWRVSQESFWNGISQWVPEFKVRGSWGKTGNQSVALYSYFPTLNLLNYTFNGLPAQGYVQQKMINEDITWETTTQTNIGIDAQLLGNKVSVSIDRYNKRTDGILLVLPVPGTLGLQPAPQNAGIVDNKGWEFAVNTHNTIGKVSLDVGFNFNVNKNKVIDLKGTGPYITGSITAIYNVTAEGLPINSLWGYKTGGLFQTQAEVDNYPTIGAGIKPGDIKFLDLNGDKKIDAGDMTYIGNTFPEYTYGSSINASYNGFSLNVLLQGAAKFKTNFNGALGDNGNLEGFAHKLLTNNYWTPDNPNARFPRPTKLDVRNSYQNDRELINGSYLRVKNIQLVYQLPEKLFGKTALKRVSIYAAGTNLITISDLNEWGLDPESAPGRVEYYPQTKLYTLGVNVQL